MIKIIIYFFCIYRIITQPYARKLNHCFRTREREKEIESEEIPKFVIMIVIMIIGTNANIIPYCIINQLIN